MRKLVSSLRKPGPITPSASFVADAGAAEAIAREKQLKSWKRDWKIKLIEKENPDWNDRSGLILQLG
jgi:predicted GIY-YIG superfamily endonuclease